jgi:hypothetical protein
MVLLKVALLIACVICGLVYLALSISAYSKRIDRSFLGGVNMLNGWWLVFPYGHNGISREHKNLVFWGRLIFLVFGAFGFAAYVIGR